MNKPTVLKYIKDQPRALREAFLKKEIFLEPLLDSVNWKKIKKIYLLGSGTSYNVSTITAHYIKDFLNVNVQVEYPTFFVNHIEIESEDIYEKDEIVFIGLSQSGTSTSTIAAIEHAKEKGYQTIVYTENLESEIVDFTDYPIKLLCGKELLPPETRGYTVSVLTMFLSFLEIGLYVGQINQKNYEQLLDDTQYLLDNFEEILTASEKWYDNNRVKFAHSDKIIVLGYGIDYGSALEGMLKIGEMYREPCIGYELEEYIHGPTMALKKETSIIVFGSDEIEWERMLFIREKFLNHTKRVSVLTYKDFDKRDTDLVFDIKTNKYLAPIMFTIPMQFLSAKGAIDIGIDTAINPFGESLGHL